MPKTKLIVQRRHSSKIANNSIAGCFDLVRESDPLLAGLRGHQGRVRVKGADGPAAGRLRPLFLADVPDQRLHVLPDQRGDLEGLRGGQYHLALLVVAPGDDHEAVPGGGVAQNAGVVVGAERVAGSVL